MAAARAYVTAQLEYLNLLLTSTSSTEQHDAAKQRFTLRLESSVRQMVGLTAEDAVQLIQLIGSAPIRDVDKERIVDLINDRVGGIGVNYQPVPHAPGSQKIDQPQNYLNAEEWRHLLDAVMELLHSLASMHATFILL